jgi:hypothetical protein
MSKVYFLFIFLGSSIAYAQSTTFPLNVFKFEDDSLKLNSDYFENKTFSFDFIKQEKPFSIYNPIPGINTINSVSYYSLKNTSRLLSNEMKNLEKEPIFPEVKKESLGETIFYGVIDSIFDK